MIWILFLDSGTQLKHQSNVDRLNIANGTFSFKNLLMLVYLFLFKNKEASKKPRRSLDQKNDGLYRWLYLIDRR